MKQMKTALEIALERLGDVQADPDLLERKRYEELGKKLFGKARTTPSADIHKEIEAQAKEKRAYIQAGFLAVYLQSIVLPTNEKQLETIDELQHCAELFAKDPKHLRQPFSQLESISRQYLSILQQIDSMLNEQFAPVVKEREMQMTQKLGYAVKLDYAALPEYTRQRNQAINQYRERFTIELNGFKDQLRSLLTKYST